MKKFTKILVAILALACMVSVMAVSASAAVKNEVYVAASNNGEGFVFDSNADPKLQTGKVDVKVPQPDFQVYVIAPANQAVPASGQSSTQKNNANVFPGEYKDWDYIMNTYFPTVQVTPAANATAPAGTTASK